ncbi:tRNA glutamyl-Q(34) synthetase GluQRS [Citricoccus sp. GCM10030269]|uniref:tRNA glutamyl-Q(34) synthetase GluQRS n=1 Tax=Citricoccus sp. GCM10030269 TaxID=3273388 RepID=UPI0036070C5A
MPAGRYAPSPTGTLHLGNLRTAMVAWLCARQTDRAFLLRIEDLDRVRSGSEAEQRADLQAIGVSWDAPPVRQSERLPHYEAALNTLIREDLVYECYCSRKDIAEAASAPHLADVAPQNTIVLPPGTYPGTCRNLSESDRRRRRRERPAALRINAARAAGLPDGTAPSHSVTDELAGEVTAAVDDFVLRRNDGAFAYNLAVVVDDVAQGIDQVVRGHDLLSSAPRQDWLARLLSRYTGQTLPETEYIHVPLVLNRAGQRLAKRDGAVTLQDVLALPDGSPGLPDGGRSPARVRDLLLDSLGLPPGPLEQALASFDPHRIPGSPWTPPQVLTDSAQDLGNG